MNMKIATLKQAVEHIELGDDQKRQMIRELKKGKRVHRSHADGLRAAAAFVVCILAVGILSVPVRALVNSLVQARMEEVPKEEIKTLVEQLDSQQVGGDGYTRSYTEAEKSREKELYQQYINGTFPTGEIPQVDSEAEAMAYDFCFLTTASVFYLPADRELTDEEILEKIDFEQKRNYALRERYEEEYAVEAGGITEAQGVEIATGYFKRIFGLDDSSLELNHYYDAEAAQIVTGEAAYCVNWSDMSNSQHYDFWIGIADGRLLGMAHSGEGIRERSEAVRPAIEEAPDKIARLKEQAERFLRDKMQIQETYDRVRSCYQTTSEGDISLRVGILFVKADGTAHLVECRWDGTVDSYSATTEKAYEEVRLQSQEVMGKRYTEEYGREVTVQNVWN